MRTSTWTISSLVLAAAFAAGCSSAAREETGPEASMDPIVDVNHTDIKRQSIGNCWVYATLGWAESLNKTASSDGQTAMNLSESYVTYWHWFDQIANGEVYGADAEIQTGGSFYEANKLMQRYGITLEKDFIPEEEFDEMSARQHDALEAINLSLKSGVLSTDSARRDRAKVRAELDRAWRLSENAVSYLDRIFNEDVSRTLDKSSTARYDAQSTPVMLTDLIPVVIPDPQTHQPVRVTLDDAIGKSSWDGDRYAWHTEYYPSSATSRRDFLRRVQRALHDRQPVIVSWLVDFNALEAEGNFRSPPTIPGRQGGHLVSLEDYEAYVPGVGLLEAGKEVTDKATLEAALSEDTEIKFLRVKNSWGTYRPDRNFSRGYHDLHMPYLDGPIDWCTQVNDTSDPTDCTDRVPLREVVLPAGY